MPVPVSPVPWAGSLIWLAALTVVSFLVTWVAADQLRVRRTPYIAVPDCGLLAVGYLVTASPIAPALGHVLGHATGLVHGTELPPHPHRAPPVSAEPVKPQVA